ncbi:hypothetical protein [Microbacterium thalassium]|uniref:DUF4386 family protein n=1 Tax=Microbacterium thalassium TaxID=362649 RepID=A0A7X0FPX6_9MICO|nr:hypothetical protein [Microbacterium thalassium]MBB6390941.1 hypothetical protein [Microbacterium thalassium]GLK26050.1 hypothetical protein GCM10017607_33690 [Microbacterium thalassium]
MSNSHRASVAVPIATTWPTITPTTRWTALVGTVLYLLELVFLFGLWVAPAAGLSAAELTQHWAANAGMHAFNVACVSIAVLGRIVFAAAVRDALRVSPRVRVVADIAFAITVAGVAIEIALMTVGSGVAVVGAVDEGAAVLAAGIVGLGQAGTGVPVAMGISGILLSIAMLRTKVVASWISVVGLLGGIAFAALILAPLPGLAAFATPVALLALVLVVIWMLATSIAFIRRTNA